jgi:hypothetical protein
MCGSIMSMVLHAASLIAGFLGKYNWWGVLARKRDQQLVFTISFNFSSSLDQKNDSLGRRRVHGVL